MAVLHCFVSTETFITQGMTSDKTHSRVHSKKFRDDNPSEIEEAVRVRRDIEVKGMQFKRSMTILPDGEDPIKAQKGAELISCKDSANRPSDFVALLKLCAKKNDLQKGSQIHAHILKDGMNFLQNNVYVGSALVNMYAKCGELAKAQEVFDELPVRNVVTWSALITGYTQHGHGEKALICFEEMKRDGIIPNVVTFLCILKACASIRALGKGQAIHAEIVKEGLLEGNTSIGNVLVDMYAKCGELEKSEEVFDSLPYRDVVSWNTLLTGYTHHGHCRKALHCYERMQQEGLSPDAFTYVCILGACGSMGSRKKGEAIHAKILKENLLAQNVLVGNALVDMYSKCGAHRKAQEVFDELPVRNVVTWNALITGHVQHGHAKEALYCFEHMQLEGISPNPVTFLNILKACGSVGAVDKGQEIHHEIVRQDLLREDNSLGTALMDMYAKCGALTKAHEVFDELPTQDVVSWSVLIAGYNQHGCGEEALTCFEHMQHKGVSPNAVTFISVLQACGSVGATNEGHKIHAKILKDEFLKIDMLVGTALVDMYFKCGFFDRAQEIFNKLQDRTVACWNVLIAGYAQLGMHDIVFYSFENMIREDTMPDFITLTIMLNACSHSGLVDKGQMYFETIIMNHGIVPSLEHYTCMIDLFCRAGQFDKAIVMIKEMPFCADVAVWHAMLGSCQQRGNIEFGKLAFESVLKLGEKDAAAYICMSNIYAAAGMQEDANKLERVRKDALVNY